MKLVYDLCAFVLLVVLSWAACIILSAVLGFEVDSLFILVWLIANLIVWGCIKLALYLARQLEDEYLDV